MLGGLPFARCSSTAGLIGEVGLDGIATVFATRRVLSGVVIWMH